MAQSKDGYYTTKDPCALVECVRLPSSSPCQSNPFRPEPIVFLSLVEHRVRSRSPTESQLIHRFHCKQGTQTGDLIDYINKQQRWTIEDKPEICFHPINANMAHQFYWISPLFVADAMDALAEIDFVHAYELECGYCKECCSVHCFQTNSLTLQAGSRPYLRSL